MNARIVMEVLVEFKMTVFMAAVYKVTPKSFDHAVFKGDQDTFESLCGESESDKGNDVTCWICNIHGHMSRDSFFNQGRSKGKGRDKSRKASDQKDGERE